MKITFISPKFHNVWEPLGIGYIKSYCDENNEHEWQFFHGNFHDDEEIIFNSYESDIVAFSCTTSTFQKGLDLVRRIKSAHYVYSKKKCAPLIVFGGWHVTTSQNINYYLEKSGINMIFQGEGEEAFNWLLKKDFDADPSPHISLDKLKWPDRDFIQQNRFLDLCEKQCGERILSFQSRRGCMMNCSMCGERCMSGKGVRIRDNEDLLNEIDYAFNRYNATMFKFVDPTWSYPRSVAREFCKKKIKRNNFKWESMVHASYLDEELINLMKEANCLQMNVGCESGSQRILNEMGKGTTIQQIKKVFKLGKSIGIQMRAFFMLGLEKSMDDFEKTKQLIRDISPDVLGVSILCPYPGTDFYRDEFESEDWSKIDEYNSFWYNDFFTNKDFLNMQKDIYREFKSILIPHQKYKIGE